MSKDPRDTRSPDHAKRRKSKIWRKMGRKYKDYNVPGEIQGELGSTGESKASEKKTKDAYK